MAEHPPLKVKRFGPPKSKPSTAQISKKRVSGPIKKAVSPAIPVPQAPVAVPQAAQIAAPLPQPAQIPPVAPSATQPAPPPVRLTIPKAVVAPQPAASPPPEYTNNPTQNYQITPAKEEKTVQKKVLQGKPLIQTEAEDLKDEVVSYLEVCDSCLSENNSPEDIVDVVHMLVRSLNLDVVTIVMLDDEQKSFSGHIASRGYNTPPGKSVIDCWNKAIIKGEGVDWGKLMKVAEDTQIDLAYWILQEGLNSIGYVPIRDSKKIYGFLFVADGNNKKTSPLTSFLLDACGSRIGLAYALKKSNTKITQMLDSITSEPGGG